MNEAVTAAYSFLREQYSSQLGVRLAGPTDSVDPSDGIPTWHWQDADLRHIDAAERATGGLVFDPEIGICAFVQSYSRAADVKGQLARALRIRSDLLPGRKPTTDDFDERGEWRVVLHWLVEQADLSVWINQVAEIRQETAHFEEVPVDAIVSGDGGWATACEAHGFPRLLFRARNVLSKSKQDDALAWASAEPVILAKLQDVHERVSGALTSSIALQFVQQMRLIADKTPAKSAAASPAEPEHLYRLSIENFRNLQRLSLDLRSQDELVTANVIQGPNGSGKSSIFEALMLAVASTSVRYRDFLSDSNDTAQGKPRRYIERYLTSLRTPSRLPRVGFNGNPLMDIQVTDPETASARYEALSGTFLSQTSNDNLLNRRADQLGAQIAGSFSGIAGAAFDWLDRQQAQADAERTQFNREWGIRQNVSRSETARERITEVVLSGVLPLPKAVQDWALTAPARLLQTTTITLVKEWQTVVSRQPELFREISRSTSKASLAVKIRTFLGSKGKALNDISAEITRIAAGRSEASQSVARDLGRWGEWLSGVRPANPSPDTDEIIRFRSEANATSSLLSHITAHGAALRERLSHLDGLGPFLSQHWLSIHQSTCPTCGSDLQAQGGLAPVIRAVRRDTEQSLAKLRADYQEARKGLDAISEQLSAAGADEPPISSDRQMEIVNHVRRSLGIELDPQHFADLTVRSDVSMCLDWINRAPQPSLSPIGEGELEAQALELADRTWDAFQRFSAVSDMPEAWKQVHKAVVDLLTEAVGQHLPQTVQALWWELARNMMPAPWQYPGDVEFQVSQRRGQPEARVVIRGSTHPLATHILNGAENHNLAVAWFLTRYLITGRFNYAFIVLDEPAHQMDQPTFRDLCRLLESLMRLHRFRGVPLTLVLLLHQDERALDAARATDGTLHLLRWNKGTAALTRHMRMRSATVLPRKPYRIMEGA